MLRRMLLLSVVGLLAAGILTGYNVAFAQEITSDDTLGAESGNVIWMVGAFLVFFMQAGFAFLGAGLIRSKNSTNYLTKSFMDFAMASLSFWAFGFALMWGTSAAGIAGTTNWFLTDSGGGQNYVDWVFQMVFAATAADYRGRRDGRAHQDPGVPGLQLPYWGHNLPPLRPLGLGRRLVGFPGRHWTAGGG